MSCHLYFPVYHLPRGAVPPPPSADCCSNVQTLASKVTTTEDRRTLCKCYQSIPPSTGIKLDRIQAIPQYCKVNVTIPTDPHVDCNR
ncbi:hypothetical protein NL676_004911 [Syzygium grande]|nr:hypothetical protein NL676_004911 [Syzygium grande]